MRLERSIKLIRSNFVMISVFFFFLLFFGGHSSVKFCQYLEVSLTEASVFIHLS
jgi:hypothetical protein